MIPRCVLGRYPQKRAASWNVPAGAWDKYDMANDEPCVSNRGCRKRDLASAERRPKARLSQSPSWIQWRPLLTLHCLAYRKTHKPPLLGALRKTKSRPGIAFVRRFASLLLALTFASSARVDT
jgi:hypothetical protein